MMHAGCKSFLVVGFDAYMRSLFNATLSKTIYDDLFESLSHRAVEFYRGEVWSLKHLYGTLSRFIDEPTNGGGILLTPSVVTTWLNDTGTIFCSCVGRSAHGSGCSVRHLRPCVGDRVELQHVVAHVRPTGHGV